MILRAIVAACAALISAPLAAQSIAAQDSFPVGTGDNGLCTAQVGAVDRALVDMFDRGYAIICRDAAAAVGRVYALRTRGGDPVARLATLRADRVRCAQPGGAELEGLGAVESIDCRLLEAEVGYRVYVHRAGGIVYVAEGLAGYDSALRLALRSVIADRVVPGEVEVATTGAGDPTAFARAQAGALDRQRALAEAYRRNNAGSFAESAEFFSVLTQGQTEASTRAEALVNQALQTSNIGRFAEADALFATVRPMVSDDPVGARRYRNYRAIHLLNQGLTADASAELDRPLPGQAVDAASLANGVIDAGTAARLSGESPGAQRLAGVEGLTPQDKARVLDGQARQLRGAILRQQGRTDEAARALTLALDDLVAVRGGRIAATIWLRAQIFGELAGIAEARRNPAEAERFHREAVALLDINYPNSSALFSAKGRLAGFLLRAGRPDEGVALFRQIVAASSEANSRSLALGSALAPYFALLAERSGDSAAVAEMFAASQVLLRPGVAQTQEVLARELSGGSSEASSLFRRSVSLTRELERARVELTRISGLRESPATAARAGELRAQIARIGNEQVATQAQLANFPRYRVVATGAMSLADLQAQLRAGEVYYKLVVVDEALYAVVASNSTARSYRLALSADELEGRVSALRSTITVARNGVQLTYAFNVALAHQMYNELFGPASAEIAAARHLIFEPDGAMLRLPPNILVMEQAGVDAYRARVAASIDNEFDFRGIAWLGRGRDVSTAVSARAFRDVRTAPPSRATAQYLGLGQNAPVGATALTASGGVRSVDGDACAWPVAAWGRPISAAELVTARNAIAAAPGAGEIVTGDAFTDTAITSRDDLRNYRILHFATHGLVTAPRPDCPARPALVTSFGDGESDGLLTFAEIFDLTLDADLIVLSACDTAGRAGLDATAEAGLTSGGDFALDGLVRAFVGAGGRLVVASHWPVPDDYNATQRLISGLFTAPPGTSAATALRIAEEALMDAADTSHPYYWAGFAVIGDGAAPVVRTVAAANTVASPN